MCVISTSHTLSVAAYNKPAHNIQPLKFVTEENSMHYYYYSQHLFKFNEQCWPRIWEKYKIIFNKTSQASERQLL